MRLAALSLLIGLAASPAWSDEPPCRARQGGDALDFWIGEWSVASEDGKTFYGDNSITSVLGGCVILEDWREPSGDDGKSFFTFDARTGVWDQVWATADTSRAGGLKRKTLVSQAKGAAQFQGAMKRNDGTPYLDRTTLTLLRDGRVRQLIEISTDNGATWRAVFDGYYSRRPAN